MKLEIEPFGMRIVTETVQDVAYLKQLGYRSQDPNLYLKVTTSGTWEYDCSEDAEIHIRWEDKNTASDDRRDRTVIQHVEGPSLHGKMAGQK